MYERQYNNNYWTDLNGVDKFQTPRQIVSLLLFARLINRQDVVFDE